MDHVDGVGRSAEKSPERILIADLRALADPYPGHHLIATGAVVFRIIDQEAGRVVVDGACYATWTIARNVRW